MYNTITKGRGEFRPHHYPEEPNTLRSSLHYFASVQQKAVKASFILPVWE